MTRIIALIICAASSYIACGQGKIKYTIANGLRIEGVDATNAIIYDNDMLEDTPEDEYLWLKYHNGKVNLVGNIITRNMDQCNLGNCKYSMQQTVDQWNRVTTAAKNAGMKLLTPVHGSDRLLLPPSSGRIEDTKWTSSAGADLIIREALKCTKEKPLVVLIGGQATTVANAYLKNPAIADRVFVIHVNGYRDRPAIARGFNTLDPWSAYVVMKKMRYINFHGDEHSWYKGRNSNLTQAMINSLPNQHFANSIKSWYSRFFRVEQMADAPPVLYLFHPSLWRNVVRKLENGQTTTSDNYDYLLISENDWSNYGPYFINYMKDPASYQQANNTNKLPSVNITAPANNSNHVAGTSINITANASDSDGSITKFEFFNGNTKLGEDATAPYSFQWTNVQAGSYTITAKATDNQNGVTTSAAANIIVASANKPPLVNITAPANNSNHVAGSSINITVNATDSDGSLTKVEFFNGNTKLGEDATSPYSFQWTNVQAGSYTITAKATDNQNGVTTSAAANIIVASANKPPLVNITAPANNSNHVAASSINITVNATDSDGSITKVEFFNGDTKLGEDATSPYSFQWTNVQAGSYTITAKATDNQNGVTTSAAANIIVASANKPPLVNITAPANNSNHVAGTSINITANASDSDGSITKVEFFNGNTKLGEDATSPYSFQWTNVQAGSYAITAKAIDNQNGVATSSATSLIVAVPNTPPAVQITSPGENATLLAGSNVTIQSTASDQNGSVTKVEFYNGSTKLGEDLTSPYTFVWNNIPAGTFSITAKATDNQGLSTTSAVVKIVVNTPNARPVVTLTSPVNNAVFDTGSTISISANATDKDGAIEKVEFYQGNAKLGEDITSPYSFEWKNVPAGNYSITAKAIDNDAAIGTSAAVNIKVATPNSPPTVSLTAPVNHSSFVTDSPITISATAADADGTIAKVEFYSGTTKLGEDNTAPYNFNWDNAVIGTHSITAKATDNKAATTISSPVKIQVVAPAAPTVVITSPANNASVENGSTLTISANATVANGSILKVEFYNGAEKLGEDLTSPYNHTWTDVPAGNHVVTAKATSDQSIVVSSKPVNITVMADTPVTEPTENTLTADAGRDTTISLPNNAVMLAGTATSSNGDPITQQWIQISGPPVSIANVTSSELALTNLTEGVYAFEFKVSDTHGNSVADIVVVEVISSAIASNVIPRYFTPNDDGVNDTWEFQSHELLENAHVTIFNRAGQKIYEAFAYQDPWDGTLEGKPLVEDAYYYVIRLSDSNDIKGAVRIIR